MEPPLSFHWRWLPPGLLRCPARDLPSLTQFIRVNQSTVESSVWTLTSGTPNWSDPSNRHSTISTRPPRATPLITSWTSKTCSTSIPRSWTPTARVRSNSTKPGPSSPWRSARCSRKNLKSRGFCLSSRSTDSYLSPTRGSTFSHIKTCIPKSSWISRSWTLPSSSQEDLS